MNIISHLQVLSVCNSRSLSALSHYIDTLPLDVLMSTEPVVPLSGILFSTKGVRLFLVSIIIALFDLEIFFVCVVHSHIFHQDHQM